MFSWFQRFFSHWVRLYLLVYRQPEGKLCPTAPDSHVTPASCLGHGPLCWQTNIVCPDTGSVHGEQLSTTEPGHHEFLGSPVKQWIAKMNQSKWSGAHVYPWPAPQSNDTKLQIQKIRHTNVGVFKGSSQHKVGGEWFKIKLRKISRILVKYEVLPIPNVIFVC